MNLDQSISLVDLPSRGKPRTLRLPTNWLGDVLWPTGVLPLDNLQTAALKALNSPIGCPPLHELVRPGQRVALLVDDYTRLDSGYNCATAAVGSPAWRRYSIGRYLPGDSLGQSPGDDCWRAAI